MWLKQLESFMQNNPLVSIIIPTYNRKKSCERLLRSIITGTYKNIEIIVIDDASRDGTSNYLNSKFKNNKKIKIFRNKKNLFAAGSKNVGQKKSKGKYIAFIDDDNVIDKKMIGVFVDAFRNNPSYGELGPINYNFNNKRAILHTSSTRSMWTTKTKHLRTLKPFGLKKMWEVDDVPNAFMVRADIIKKNKIEFRPSYGIMYEESDYAYRIRKAGYKIMMLREAKIYHDIEDLSGKEKPKDYLYHFMEDKRRAFTFARNRIVFHYRFSTKVQNFFILGFWVWFFAAYYLYRFMFYNGFGNFSIKSRIHVSFNYLKGTVNGYKLLLHSNK